MPARRMSVIPLAALLLCFLLASLPGLQPAASSESQATVEWKGDFVLRDAFWSDWRGRGLNNTFCVVLTYVGAEEATSLNAVLDVSAVSPEQPLVSDSYPWPLGHGQAVYFYFTFPVSEKAIASHYNFTLALTYLCGGEARSYGLIIPATIEGVPHMAVLCETWELEMLTVNDVVLVVRNVGDGVARGLRLEVDPQSPCLTILGPNTFERSFLCPGQAWRIHIQVFAEAGEVRATSLRVTVSYLDQHGCSYTQNVALGFGLSSPSGLAAELAISRVIYMPPAIMPGDRYVFLMVILTNIGNCVAREVRLELLGLPGVVEPSYAGAGEAMIPYMPVGYVANVTFLVDVAEDAEPGFYEIPLQVRHDDLNYTLEVPLTIREKAAFRVAKLEFSPKPYPGAKGVRVVIELQNIANVTAQEVRVSLVSAYVRGVTSLLLGDMMGGEKRVAVLEVDFDEASPLKLEFELQVSWRQGERSLTHTIRCSTELKVPSKWPEAREIAIWIGLVALGAAISFTVMKVRRGFF